MINEPDDEILKTYTGLEGGVVGAGSTCGVVSGGSMGLAISHYDEIIKNGLPAKIAMLSMVGNYVKWFDDQYGSTFCRERSGVDFHSRAGQIRYLIPGDKILKCMWHINGALKHLYSYHKETLPATELNINDKIDQPIHCAERVLKGIKEQTKIGNERLEQLSFIFDGGLGLKGGVCGALAGAIMGINLLIGLNIRDLSYFQSLNAFKVGHENLLKSYQKSSPEPFNVGNQILQKFKNEAGSLECETISGKLFVEWNDFQNFVKSSNKCARLTELVTNEASRLIELCKPMMA